MATYSAASLGIKEPAGGFQQGGWYGGRQYWNGSLSEVNQIHPSSNQVGAGQEVSKEVVSQSAAAQGKTTADLYNYFAAEKAKQAQTNPTPTGSAGSAYNAANMPGLAGAANSGNLGFSTNPTLNLPELYKTLTDESGISDSEAQLADMERQFAEAKGKINDNPYLSEATRVGRVAKLEELHGDRTKAIRDSIATKKADIETRLNLETKQFDINSESAQLALQQFNSLLSMGALDNASGEDIASITRSTGLSSNMIISAVEAQKRSNLQIITETFDDGTNEGFTIYAVDPSGNVVNSTKEVTGKSSKAAGSSYSSDPVVSAFLSRYLNSDLSPDGGSDIDGLWGEDSGGSSYTTGDSGKTYNYFG